MVVSSAGELDFMARMAQNLYLYRKKSALTSLEKLFHEYGGGVRLQHAPTQLTNMMKNIISSNVDKFTTSMGITLNETSLQSLRDDDDENDFTRHDEKVLIKKLFRLLRPEDNDNEMVHRMKRYALRRLIYNMDMLRKEFPRKSILYMTTRFPSPITDAIRGKKQVLPFLWMQGIRSWWDANTNIRATKKRKVNQVDQILEMYKNKSNNIGNYVPFRKISIAQHPSEQAVVKKLAQKIQHKPRTLSV